MVPLGFFTVSIQKIAVVERTFALNPVETPPDRKSMFAIPRRLSHGPVAVPLPAASGLDLTR